jgi:hypothetical protein
MSTARVRDLAKRCGTRTGRHLVTRELKITCFHLAILTTTVRRLAQLPSFQTRDIRPHIDETRISHHTSLPQEALSPSSHLTPSGTAVLRCHHRQIPHFVVATRINLLQPHAQSRHPTVPTRITTTPPANPTSRKQTTRHLHDNILSLSKSPPAHHQTHTSSRLHHKMAAYPW